jgi:hypothetical protein
LNHFRDARHAPADRRTIASDRFSIADITAVVAVDSPASSASPTTGIALAALACRDGRAPGDGALARWQVTIVLATITASFFRRRARFMTPRKADGSNPAHFRPAERSAQDGRVRGAQSRRSSWRASSLDLALRSLDVKVMQSKLSAETLHRLFGS